MTTPPALPEYEEWRIALGLPEGDLKAGALIGELRSRLPSSIDIHRKGRRGVRLYTDSRSLIAEAEDVLRERLESHRVWADLELTRWNAGEERWQSPLLPVQPPRAPLPDQWSTLDEKAWEVRMRFEHHREADQLLHELRKKDAPAVGGWKRCLVVLPDEATARQRAEEMRLSAPLAEMEVRPLSRFRWWLIRQKLFGNYA